jgi:hypothetical protein
MTPSSQGSIYFALYTTFFVDGLNMGVPWISSGGEGGGQVTPKYPPLVPENSLWGVWTPPPVPQNSLWGVQALGPPPNTSKQPLLA